MRLLASAASSLLVACVATEGALPSQTVDRASLRFTSNGDEHHGTAVIQRASRTVITFHLPRDTQELAISTCHREEFHRDPGETFRWAYVPTFGLENWDTCLVRATAFLSSGRAERALIDWTSNETLPANISCNGVQTKAKNGASFCQSRAGLVQRVTFSENVSARTPERCNKPYNKRETETSWEWFVDLSPGLCIYAFRTQEGNLLHRLTTYGYTKEGL
jgi:hypothetical protein